MMDFSIVNLLLDGCLRYLLKPYGGCRGDTVTGGITMTRMRVIDRSSMETRYLQLIQPGLLPITPASA